MWKELGEERERERTNGHRLQSHSKISKEVVELLEWTADQARWWSSHSDVVVTCNTQLGNDVEDEIMQIRK